MDDLADQLADTNMDGAEMTEDAPARADSVVDVEEFDEMQTDSPSMIVEDGNNVRVLFRSWYPAQGSSLRDRGQDLPTSADELAELGNLMSDAILRRSTQTHLPYTYTPPLPPVGHPQFPYWVRDHPANELIRTAHPITVSEAARAQREDRALAAAMEGLATSPRNRQRLDQRRARRHNVRSIQRPLHVTNEQHQRQHQREHTQTSLPTSNPCSTVRVCSFGQVASYVTRFDNLLRSWNSTPRSRHNPSADAALEAWFYAQARDIREEARRVNAQRPYEARQSDDYIDQYYSLPPRSPPPPPPSPTNPVPAGPNRTAGHPYRRSPPLPRAPPSSLTYRMPPRPTAGPGRPQRSAYQHPRRLSPPPSSSTSLASTRQSGRIVRPYRCVPQYPRRHPPPPPPPSPTC